MWTTLASFVPAMGVVEVLLAIVVLLVVRHYYRTAGFWSRKGVTSSPGVPILGSSPAFVLQTEYRGYSMQRFYTEARAKDLPCIGLFVGSAPVLLLTDVDLVRTIMVKDFSHFMDRGMPFDRKGEPLTANLFNLEGGEWRALRHKLTPTFTSGRMRAMFPLVRACAEELEHVLSTEAATGKPIEMFELLARFTTDVIGTCAFGIQANTLKDPEAEFRVMGRKAFQIPLATMAFLVVVPQLLPFFKKVFSVRLINKSVADFFTRVFQENIEHRQHNKVLRPDFVELLMQIKTKGQLADDDGSLKAEAAGGIDEDILPAQAFIFFLAGFETSSSTLGNVMTELAHNPDVQDKARAEVERVLAKHGGNLTYEALNDLTYMDQIIDETMRLYPAASNMARVVTQDYALPFNGPDGRPAVLEKGLKVIIPTYALHRDPEFFPEPDKFDPERFTEEAKQSRPHYSYMPFGEGPRICIGLRFAMMQMKSGLATVLHKFRVAPVEGLNDYPARFEAATFVTKVVGGNKVLLHPVDAAPQPAS